MSERGSALPMVLGVVAAAIVVLALGVDVTLYAAATREVANAADIGAAAGAAEVDVAARYRGELAVDTTAAVDAATEAALATRPRLGRQVVVMPEADRVCVTVRQPFAARVVAVTQEITVTACAVPVEG